MSEWSEYLIKHRAHANHIATVESGAAYRSHFDKLILGYLNLAPRTGRTGLRDGRRAAMIEALDNRASWDQIRDWRHDYRSAPAWAIRLLTAKLSARRQAIDYMLS